MAQTNIQFGTYVFPDQFIVAKNELDFVSDIVAVPFQPGSNVPTPATTRRTITVVGSLGGGGPNVAGAYLNSISDVQGELDKVMASLRATTVTGPGQLFVPSGDRFYWAIPGKPALTFVEGAGYRYVDLSLPFICGDPRAYSIAQRSTNVGPFTDAIVHAFTVNNAGNTRAYPLIVVGAAAGATVGFQGVTVGLSVGANYARILMSTTMPAMVNQAILVFSCDPLQPITVSSVAYNPRTISPAGYIQYATFQNTVGNLEFFPYLEPGINTLTVAATQAPSGGTIGYNITVYWYDTWL